MVLNPRHRGDCAEFFVAPDQTESLQFDGPADAIGAIEHAAASTGRTWNDQFNYVMGVCLGYHLPDFDDARSVEDWRTVMGPCAIRESGGADWTSFERLPAHATQKGR